MESGGGDVSGDLERDEAPSNVCRDLSLVPSVSVPSQSVPFFNISTTPSFGQSAVLGNPTAIFGRPSSSIDLSRSVFGARSAIMNNAESMNNASEQRFTNTMVQPGGVLRFLEAPSRPAIAGAGRPIAQREKNRPTFRAGDECVAFIVRDEKKFQVHKAFAIHYSIKLKAAFEDESSVEYETKSYRMDYASEKSVSLLVQWIYTQSLDIETFANENKSSITNHLAILWVLAGNLKIPRLQNTAMGHLERLRISSAQRISSSELEFLYGNTTTGSPLRKYIVDDFANHAEAEVYLANPHMIPKEMLLELAVYFKENMVHKQTVQVFGLRVSEPEKDMSQYFVAEV